jgi:BCD family chlorophyll transporter-like MFS transporter
VPFIWNGTLAQFGGLAIMPFAILVLAGSGHAAHAPKWIGYVGAAGAFLLTGAGLHTIQTVGLALATDLAPADSRPKVVGLMYVMLALGMIASALLFGALLVNFTNGRLIQVIQGAALATMILNVVAVWKQESRHGRRAQADERPPAFTESWASFIHGDNAVLRLVAVGVGTMAFSMEDVLLEPYGGQVLHLTVGATTKLTATLAVGAVIGFGLASRVLSRGADPFRMASSGALVGAPAFMAVIMAAPLHNPWLFGVGTLMIGFGGGLFSHGTLTATMNAAPQGQAGLALGAWGAVQATAAGAAIALGGIIRDVVAAASSQSALGAATGYDFVYIIEMVLLFVTLAAMFPLVRRLEARA